MKNILVLIHDDVGQEARFQAALDVTRVLGGHLICLDVAIMPANVADCTTFGGTALLVSDERVTEARNRARIDARLQHEGVAYHWVDTVGFASESVIEAARFSELIVLNRVIRNSYPDMEEITGEVLLKAARPVLAVPAGSRGFAAHGKAMIAWDGSKEADRALLAAIPLLLHAGSVTIVEVEDGSAGMPAEHAATHLSRHWIKPVIHRTPAGNKKAGTVLLDQVDALDAAYLVMGGFGRSRFMEAVFGGVTRRLLRESPVPLFLAH